MVEGRMIGTRIVGVCTVLLLTLCGLAGCQSANDGEQGKTGAAAFYDGRSITWIIPYSPGGGYDEYARLIAPYLEKYTGARIDILNLPGAGGMRGVNELYHSPNDGRTIGMINGSALVTNELAGMSGADYEISEFEFLGRIVADKRVFVVSKDSGYRSLDDIRNAKEEIKIGATGLGGSTYVDAVICNTAFEMNVDIIHGFDSSSFIKQAMLRGNIVGTWGSWGSAMDGVDGDRQIVILQSGRQRGADLPDTPTAHELVARTANPERTEAILTAWESLHAVGRPVALPPGAAPERVRFLREAFDKAMHDPELLALAAKSRRPLDYASGEDMSQIVAAAFAMPEDIKVLFVRAIKGEL
jgi:tripartite-type tricarboxylate transporter receptor subunit TctC